MPRPVFQAKWKAANDQQTIFQWGAKASFWKGLKGWWASRQDHEGIKGPFRSSLAAQKWAEVPFREKHKERLGILREKINKAAEAKRLRKEARGARKGARASLREAKALETWNGLPQEKRLILPGQVGAMKGERFHDHETLVVEVKKRIVVVLRREGDRPWKGCARQPMSIGPLPRLYRLVGEANLP